ncbi:MAG TPA: hypothetical protein VMD76_11485 [Candidatus Sulfotelmatobacter sp.]|nr:hypothetical protein [Candidatus Sulfotelmatobacter sp.]
MNTVKATPSWVQRTLFVLVLIMLLIALPPGALLHAQSQPGQPTQNQPAHNQPSPAPTQPNAPAQSPSAQQPATPAPPTGEPAQKGEVKITPREAEELFHTVDEIMDFDSKQTGLPIKHSVKRKLTSREQVVSYLTNHMNDEDTKRLRRSELVLKKFGLLPREFDLETFLVALLKEEVAGYYDPKTKTVNLLDWVPMEEQEPVMAHELTHALQDQAVNLNKWMKKGEKDLGELKHDPTPEDIENDEIDDTREAVLEGQAQAMMFQYAIAPTGHSIENSPALVDAMEEETLTGTAGTTVFNEAPIFLKESLTFPYSYGMNFVIKLMQTGGKEKAFAGLLKNPPHTTRQIMQPETYISGEKIDPIPVPDFSHDFENYRKFDIGAMGEFDVDVLIEQYLGKSAAKKIYPDWRGGYYYAAKSKTDKAAPLGLLYVSRWSGPEAAAQFAGIYAQSLKQRYKTVNEQGDPTPAAEKVVDKPTEADPPTDQSTDQSTNDKPGGDKKDGDKKERKADEKPLPAPLTGRHVWTTDEGTVVIEEQGDTVLVSESLDPATTSKLEKEVFSAPPVSK